MGYFAPNRNAEVSAEYLYEVRFLTNIPDRLLLFIKLKRCRKRVLLHNAAVAGSNPALLKVPQFGRGQQTNSHLLLFTLFSRK